MWLRRLITLAYPMEIEFDVDVGTDSSGNKDGFCLQNGLATVFHYGPDGELLFEVDQAGNTKAYVWLDGRPLARIDNDAQIYYYHVDRLGTPQAMTDATGTVVWKGYYDPFGNATLRVSTIENNLRLPGQYYDRETGLFYNLNRDYDPTTGRYIEFDLIGLDGGINTYTYVGGNPISYKDPPGLILLNPVTIGAAIGGVAGAIQAANAGGGWTSQNAWNIVAGAATGAGAGALAGFLPGSAGLLAGVRVGAISGAAGNAANQWLGGTPVQCTDLAQVGTQGLVGAFGGGLGYAAGFSSALGIVRAGGSAQGATAFGNIYGAVSGGTTQVISNLPIPTSLGGFWPY